MASLMITVGLERQHVVVTVNDGEVSDYIDDFLTEVVDIGGLWVAAEAPHNTSLRKFIFPKDVRLETVEQALEQLDKAELQRIWKLNN